MLCCSSIGYGGVPLSRAACNRSNESLVLFQRLRFIFQPSPKLSTIEKTRAFYDTSRKLDGWVARTPKMTPRVSGLILLMIVVRKVSILCLRSSRALWDCICMSFPGHLTKRRENPKVEIQTQLRYKRNVILFSSPLPVRSAAPPVKKEGPLQANL
jgi:hypothetical protein